MYFLYVISKAIIPKSLIDSNKTKITQSSDVTKGRHWDVYNDGWNSESVNIYTSPNHLNFLTKTPIVKIKRLQYSVE